MSKEKSALTEEQRERRKKKTIAAVILVILVILLAILLLLLLGKEEGSVVVTEDNVEQVIEDREPVQDVRYTVTMNSTWNFANGTAKSDNAYVENAETNDHPVYFEVNRGDTEERIYKSPTLAVGDHLDHFALDKELPDGTYDCIVTYHVLDENEKPIGEVKLTLTINVGQ